MSIKFNGKVYQSVDEMPPEVRRMYEDLMGIFKEDEIQGKEGDDNTKEVKVDFNFKVKVNGREFSSPDEMPEDIRREYEKALEKSRRLMEEYRGLMPGDNSEGKVDSRVKVNGREFSSEDEAPDDLRREYKKALEERRKIMEKYGISEDDSDWDEGVVRTLGSRLMRELSGELASEPDAQSEPTEVSAQAVSSAPSVMTEESVRLNKAVLIGVVVLILLVVVVGALVVILH